MLRIARERNVKGDRRERDTRTDRIEKRRRREAKQSAERRRGKKADRGKERGTGRRKMLGVGKTGERTEDIELKWPLGAHSSIPLSLP